MNWEQNSQTITQLTEIKLWYQTLKKKVSTFSFSLPKTVFIQFGTRRQQFLAKNLDQSETQAKESMERMTGFEILSFPLVQELAEAFKI